MREDAAGREGAGRLFRVDGPAQQRITRATKSIRGTWPRMSDKHAQQQDLFISAEDAARKAGDTLQAVARRLPQSEFVTVADVAAALGIRVEAVYAWIDEGKFEVMDVSAGKKPFYKINRAVFLKFFETRIV